MEHATISILLSQGAKPPIGGNSLNAGLVIISRSFTESVVSVVDQALHRLRIGEHALTVSPYCGTNLAADAAISGALIGRSIGSELQRGYTTLPEIEDLETSRINSVKIGVFNIHIVKTRQALRCS